MKSTTPEKDTKKMIHIHLRNIRAAVVLEEQHKQSRQREVLGDEG